MARNRATVPDGETIESLVRRGLARQRDHRESVTTEEVAAWLGLTPHVYRQARYVVLLSEREDLSPAHRTLVEEALADLNATKQVIRATEAVQPLVQRIYGGGERGSSPWELEARRVARFERAYGSLMQSCQMARDMDVPYLSPGRAAELGQELHRAAGDLLRLASRILEEEERS